MDLLIVLGMIAGVLTSFGIIWSKCIKPMGRFIKRVVEIHDIVVTFPDWQEKVDRDLQHIAADLPIMKLMIEDHVANTRLHRR